MPAAGAAGADLALNKTVFSPIGSVDRGAEIDFFISIQNLGDDPAGTITITDTLPVNTTFISLTGGCCGSIPSTPPPV